MKLSGNTDTIDLEPRTRFRSTVLLVIALALVGLIGTFAQTNAANPPLNSAIVSEPAYPDMPGMIDDYPHVVAYVDGRPIWGEQLAFRVYALEQSPDPNLDKSHPVRDALHGIIRDRILIDHASDYGVSVSYDEARAFVQQEKAMQLSNPPGRANVAILAQLEGASVDNYFNLPGTIQGYRQGMTLGEMRQYIWNRSTINPSRSEAGEQAALDAFANSIHAQVQILIDLP